jgi:hypothetical protein
MLLGRGSFRCVLGHPPERQVTVCLEGAHAEHLSQRERLLVGFLAKMSPSRRLPHAVGKPVGISYRIEYVALSYELRIGKPTVYEELT